MFVYSEKACYNAERLLGNAGTLSLDWSPQWDGETMFSTFSMFVSVSDHLGAWCLSSCYLYVFLVLVRKAISGSSPNSSKVNCICPSKKLVYLSTYVRELADLGWSSILSFKKSSNYGLSNNLFFPFVNLLNDRGAGTAVYDRRVDCSISIGAKQICIKVVSRNTILGPKQVESENIHNSAWKLFSTQLGEEC